jgi:hypothetical protein
MKKLMMVLLLAIGSCKEKPSEPITQNPLDNIAAGKRNYVWSVDSIDTGGRPWKIRLSTMWGSSPNDVWGTYGNGSPLDCLWHYDGVSWKPATDGTPLTADPQGQGYRIVYSVWGSGKNDVWAFGQYYHAGQGLFVMHYDGTSWQDVSATVIDQRTGLLLSNLQSTFFEPVWGTRKNGKDEIWAGGWRYVVHYDGTNWRSYDFGDSLVCSSLTSNGKDAYATVYNTYQFDANGFSLYHFVGDSAKKLDVAYSNISNLLNPYKFGFLLYTNGNILKTLGEGYLIMNTILPDGSIDTTKWQRDSTFTGSHTFWNLDVQSPKNIFAVGQRATYQYNGSDWQKIIFTVPNHQVDEQNQILQAVWTDGNEVFICDWQNGIVYHGR